MLKCSCVNNTGFTGTQLVILHPQFRFLLVLKYCSLGMFGLGCATGTLEPLAHTRASSVEFCYLVLID